MAVMPCSRASRAAPRRLATATTSSRGELEDTGDAIRDEADIDASIQMSHHTALGRGDDTEHGEPAEQRNPEHHVGGCAHERDAHHPDRRDAEDIAKGEDSVRDAIPDPRAVLAECATSVDLARRP